MSRALQIDRHKQARLASNHHSVVIEWRQAIEGEREVRTGGGEAILA